jgi:hypothetical protein
LGVLLGYKAIPDQWKSGIPSIAQEKFRYTDYSFESIIESTVNRAVKLVTRNGGRLDGAVLKVKTQTPAPAKLEIWDDYGSPQERIAVDDGRWKWSGNWTAPSPRGSRDTRARRVSAEKGAAADIEFEGTGAIITGPYLPSGGKADVYLDGKLHRTVDVFPDEDQAKGGEAVWHAFALKLGRHTLRVVVRGETYPGSSGEDIALEDLIVFR